MKQVFSLGGWEQNVALKRGDVRLGIRQAEFERENWPAASLSVGDTGLR